MTRRIILNNWKLSGFIDVGNGGVGDRHIDILWGDWTLWFNLKTNKYYARFLDAYGRDKADESVLKIVAAAEVSGDHAESCYDMFNTKVYDWNTGAFPYGSVLFLWQNRGGYNQEFFAKTICGRIFRPQILTKREYS